MLQIGGERERTKVLGENGVGFKLRSALVDFENKVFLAIANGHISTEIF
jgi:hypothetical protein